MDKPCQQVNINSKIIGRVIIIEDSPSSLDEPTNFTSNFLKRVKTHSKKCQNTEMYESRTRLMILDMESSRQNFSTVSGQTEALFGRDVKEIRMEDLHEVVGGRDTKHLMLLGVAGSGKTTLSEMYYRLANEHSLKGLEHIQIAVHVNVSELSCDATTTAFDLLFVQQMAGDPATEMTEEEQKAGMKWAEENASKMLVIIDGLDQCGKPITGKHQKISSRTQAYTNTILCNIMAGNIWRGAIILTTSRWAVYWELAFEQRAEILIGLRGYDEKNMEKAIQDKLGDGSEEMIAHIKRAAPSLFEMCRTPMFLSYTTNVYQQYRDNLPNTTSTLMAAVFVELMHCKHIDNPFFDNVAKLAYQGILENCYTFSITHLRRCGIDKSEMRDFLATGAKLLPQEIKTTTYDKRFVFVHPSMQECFAALHIINLKKEDISRLVSDRLNDISMTFTRKLFYGMILDDAVTDKVRQYIYGKTTSIEDCQQILMENLINVLRSGAINDIRIIKLIAECGNHVTEQLKNDVKRVYIDSFDLIKKDEILLVNMLEKFSPLDEVFIQQLRLDPITVENMLRVLKRSQINIFQAGYELSDSITVSHTKSVTELLTRTKLVRVNLYCSDEAKIHFLSEWLKNTEILIKHLGLFNVGIPQVLRKLHYFLSKYPVKILHLNLEFNVSERESQISASLKSCNGGKLLIEDKSLERTNLAAYFDIFTATSYASSALCRCELSPGKLEAIADECARKEVRLKCLRVIDNSLAEDGYRELASVLASTKGRIISLESCNLTKEKLEYMWEGCQKYKVTVERANIFDDTIASSEFSDLAGTLHRMGCTQISFIGCHLDVEKLSEFHRGCIKLQGTFPQLYIGDKRLSEEGYTELSSTIMDIDCRELILAACDLNKTKLSRLCQGFQEKTVNLSCLCILQDRFLEQESFKTLVSVTRATGCQHLIFFNCRVNSENLLALYEQCIDERIKIEHLYLVNYKYEPSQDEIRIICKLVSDTVDHLVIGGWNVSNVNEIAIRNHSKSISLEIFSDVDHIVGSHPLAVLKDYYSSASQQRETDVLIRYQNA